MFDIKNVKLDLQRQLCTRMHVISVLGIGLKVPDFVPTIHILSQQEFDYISLYNYVNLYIHKSKSNHPVSANQLPYRQEFDYISLYNYVNLYIHKSKSNHPVSANQLPYRQ